MLERFDKKVNDAEMKAVTNPAPDSQFEKLNQLDEEISKLKEKIKNEQSLIENNEDEGNFQLYLKSYQLEEDLLNKLKEKKLIISDSSSGFRITSDKESSEVEDLSYLKNIDKKDSLVYRIDSLKNEIDNLKLKKPDNQIDKDLLKKRIQIINEEINEIISQN